MIYGNTNGGGFGVYPGDKMFCYDWGVKPSRVYYDDYKASSFIVSNGLGFKENGNPSLDAGSFSKSIMWSGYDLNLRTETGIKTFRSTVDTDKHYPFLKFFAQWCDKKNKIFVMSMPILTNFYDPDVANESVDGNVGLNYWVEETYEKSAFKVRTDFHDIPSTKTEYSRVFTVPTFNNLSYSLGSYGMSGDGEDTVYIGYRLTDNVVIDSQSNRRTYFKYGDISSAIARIDIKLKRISLVKTFPKKKMTLKSIANNKAYILNVETNETEIYDLSTWKKVGVTDAEINEFISQYGQEKPISKGGKLPIGDGYYDVATGYIYSSKGDELINVGKDYKVVMLRDNGNLIRFDGGYLYEHDYMTYVVPDADVRPWWAR